MYLFFYALMFHSLVSYTGLVHHYVTAKIMKIIQEKRILHDPHALYIVTLIKHILHSILNCLILESLFFFHFTLFCCCSSSPHVSTVFWTEEFTKILYLCKKKICSSIVLCLVIRCLQNFPNKYSDQGPSTQYNLKFSTIKTFTYMTVKQSFIRVHSCAYCLLI